MHREENQPTTRRSGAALAAACGIGLLAASLWWLPAAGSVRPIAGLLGFCLAVVGVGLLYRGSERSAAPRSQTRASALERTLGGAGMGVWDWDVVSGQTTFNDTFSRMLGYEPGELPAQFATWKSLVHPDDLPGAMADIEAHHRGETSVYRNEHRIRRKDGSWQWILDVGDLVESTPDGSPRRMIGVHIDLQDQKEAAQRLALAQSSARAGLWDWNVPGGFFVTNAQFHEMLDEEPSEEALPFDYFGERVHPDDLERVLEAVESSHRSDKYDYDLEFRMRKVDGEYKWIRSTGRVVERGIDGDPVRMIGQHMDVDVSKRIQLELARTQALLEETGRLSRIGGWEMDLASRTLTWTDQMYSILELPRTGAAPTLHELLDLCDPKARGFVEQRYMRAMEKGLRWDDEVPMITARGRRIWVRLKGIPRVQRGRCISLSGILQDITEQRRVREEAENAREVALEASRAKSEFLANMSHEIRTPLNGVLGMAEHLEFTELDEEQRECVRTIGSSGKALLGVINDILDFSKIEAGRIELEYLDFNIADVLREVADVAGVRAREKGIELRTDLDPDLPEAVNGDPTRLRQVLLNLSSNAVKFTESGNVTLRVAVQSRDDSGYRVRFEVRDTGIGIPGDRQEGLFRPFSQADASTTRRFGGTGLGLTISRDLVGMMDGEIELESIEGEGSTFWFDIRLGQPQQPLIEALQQAAEPEAGAPSDASSLSILLVEDNGVNELVARRFLERMGHRVTSAGHGEIALECLERERFDAVLMDCQMPVMDGYEATRRIRAGESEGQHLTVIAMTAHAMEGAREECIAAGMDEYLTKPIQRDALEQVLNRVAGAIRRVS